MSEIVPVEEIEKIVGVKRHRQAHYARAVSAEQTVYILHSQGCLDSGIDLRDCRFSVALDLGIHEGDWSDMEDRVVMLGVWHDRLVPLQGTIVAALIAALPHLRDAE